MKERRRASSGAIEYEKLEAFRRMLMEQEKSPATVDKYLRDVKSFLHYCETRQAYDDSTVQDQKELGRLLVVQYKYELQRRYKISSVNSMLVALNCFLKFTGRQDLCVRTLRQQRRLFCEARRMLTKDEYVRLVKTAEEQGKLRLACILQTLAMTGIRIGELHYLTAEALSNRMVSILHKGKARDIILPEELIRLLQAYCRSRQIQSGSIFVRSNGKPVDRKRTWFEMKQLCEAAQVADEKAFPHNLRHLFAVTYYQQQKDIVRLADYLGHSSLETTRRYTMISTMEACQQELKLGLLVSNIELPLS